MCSIAKGDFKLLILLTPLLSAGIIDTDYHAQFM